MSDVVPASKPLPAEQQGVNAKTAYLGAGSSSSGRCRPGLGVVLDLGLLDGGVLTILHALAV